MNNKKELLLLLIIATPQTATAFNLIKFLSRHFDTIETTQLINELIHDKLIIKTEVYNPSFEATISGVEYLQDNLTEVVNNLIQNYPQKEEIILILKKKVENKFYV